MTSSSSTPGTPLLYRFPTGVTVNDAGVGSLQWPQGSGPFQAVLQAQPNPLVSSIQWHPGVLNAAECDAVIALGRQLPAMAGRAELDPENYRVSQIAWIPPEPAHHWLYHKLGVLFMQAAGQFGYELEGFLDALQFTEYGAGQHFDWHMDIGRDQTSLRKLSLTIQLSEPQDYDGGMLDFVGLGSREESRQRGSATLFPSYMAHRVTPVTRGVRRSLVAWGSGRPFR